LVEMKVVQLAAQTAETLVAWTVERTDKKTVALLVE